MSNPMTVLHQQIRIPSEFKSRALTALQQVPHPQYLPFTDPTFVRAATLEEAIACFRWDAVIDDSTGDITGLTFIGVNAGAIDLLLQVMAPYIAADSFLICETEDGQRWRWNFTGFTVRFTDESDI